ncbi:PAS domain-containing sensor histidine kinase [Hansschlegelia sp. KR7-227]|uniref:PAS domain-containing sensor histidine kinase n=1 Tax=Hansschlegelia sp. KR7-227 TaxID=3400914 RepID=UPI003C063675
MLQVARQHAFLEQAAARLCAALAGDPDVSPRHAGFVATHLAVGVASFAVLPALLAIDGAPSALGLAACAWLIAPILIAFKLSRGGDLEQAQIFASVAFAAFVAAIAALDGGLASFATLWLALPAFEAALSGSRRALTAAALAAGGALVALAGVSLAGGGPASGGGAASAVGMVAASVYALALILRAAQAIGAGDRSKQAGEARFDLFAASVSDMITHHLSDGSVVFISPAARTLLGASPRDLMGQGLLARVNVADRPAFLQTLSAGGLSDQPRVAEIRIRRPSAAGRPDAGEVVWLEMSARRLRAHERDGHDAASAVVVYRDVSERKAHEEALIAAREEAERANVLKTRFLANMSHELRTPLNAIIGFSEILSDEQLCRLTPERRADYAALIHKSGAHLLDVVNSILDMAKIESGAFAILAEPCALEPIVRHCVSLMALKADSAGVALVARVPADLPEISADRRAVMQILLNLVANAVKFTPRGGEVVVELRPGAGGVALVVRDTGVGIAPEHLGRLGEAFFQIDSGVSRRHEGSGLGLSVVRGLVELHGGELGVESALGRGTSVTVFLPFDPAARRTAASKIAAPHFARAAAPTVLPALRGKQSA